MELSVIIPTYKPGEYIKDCLASLLKQSLNPAKFEVIIILNGCGEPYLSAIKAFFQENSPAFQVVLRQTDVPGVSNARNMGIDMAKGKYITFIDDDDWLSENCLENLIKSVRDERSSIGVANVINYREATGEYCKDWMTNAYERCQKEKKVTLLSGRSFFSTPWGKIIPRELIGDNRFDATFKQGEDALFMASISKRVGEIRLASSDTIYYRRLRKASAGRNRTKWSILKDSSRLSLAFLAMYLSDVLHNNLPFFANRVLAPYKEIFRTHEQ